MNVFVVCEDTKYFSLRKFCKFSDHLGVWREVSLRHLMENRIGDCFMPTRSYSSRLVRTVLREDILRKLTIYHTICNKKDLSLLIIFIFLRMYACLQFVELVGYFSQMIFSPGVTGPRRRRLTGKIYISTLLKVQSTI